MTTTTTRNNPAGGGALLAAALALPGVLPNAAQAQVTVPNATLVQFKYLYYKDYQDSGNRMKVGSPALYMLAPITDEWVFEIGAVYDNISGASPYYHPAYYGYPCCGSASANAPGALKKTKAIAENRPRSARLDGSTTIRMRA